MQIKDYIHFYIGQKAIRPSSFHQDITITLSFDKLATHSGVINEIKPILRKIGSMTEEEMKECGNLDYDFSNDPELNTWSYDNFDCMLTPNQFTWLLKRGFDLFGLIDAGLAIDASTLPQQK